MAFRHTELKKDEFQDKVLDIRRVSRVTAGGKRFRFRATVIVGDGRGRVGVGVAKGLDVQHARALVGNGLLRITIPLLQIAQHNERKIPIE